ncbi:MAG: penicillin-binding transpeptidase domain-containing protein, partial [Candidatus Kapabacteria bacterium]|nr:penicillin-binding transpeptidase domain-containing protein [Candidatus Kapabacteria bacterium]
HCAGAFYYGNRSCACHGAHGNIALERALAVSCNSYFNQLGLKLGIDKFHDYGTMFGFGQKTNVDITEESRGILASRAFMDKRYGKNGWNNYRMVNLGIGQGELGVTPLQMAVYTAALANGGTLYQPHAVRAVFNKELKKKQVVSYASKKLAVDERHFAVVRSGMRMVVEQGTARAASVPGVSVAGKTGTAQNPHGEDHSWFVCYAPAENPTIAIAIMVENGGFGAATALPIARQMLDFFFNKTWPAEVRRDSTWLRERQSSSPIPPDSIPRPTGPFANMNTKRVVALPSRIAHVDGRR